MSATRGTVFVVEDAEDVAALTAELLTREGFRPVVCPTAKACLDGLGREKPVAVLLDWTLPDAAGIEVCRRLRALDALMPIMLVSARTDEASVARGLEAGADDFVFKPFRHSELIARLEAHLRKSASASVVRSSSNQRPAQRMEFGGFAVDLDAREVSAGGVSVALGHLEFGLLEYLCRNAGVAVSREQIMNEVYGYTADLATDRVDLLVRRLRAKLGTGANAGGRIQAVPGYGYRLEK